MDRHGPRWEDHPTLRLILELLVITVYSFCVLWFFFDGGEWESVSAMQVTPGAVIAGAVGAVLWLFLAIRFVIGLVRAEAHGAYIRANFGVLLLLVAVVFTYVTWLPAIALALIVFGFVLELRRYPSGREWVTALALILFISASVSVGLVLVERSAPGSELGKLTDGMSWTVARLLRVNVDGLQEIEPLTRDGRDLAAVLALCATLFAALIVGAIVSWLTKPSQEEEAEDESEIAALTAEVVALREMVELLRSEPGRPPRAAEEETGLTSD